MSNQSQPAILPATLPAGTRTRYGNEATSELTLLAASERYCGHFTGFSGPVTFGVAVIDWDLVAVQAAVPAEKDRPIQAGDWVEVTSGNDSLPLSSRHAVRASWEDQYGDKYLDLDGFGLGGWDLDRFRRVDGPHPQSADEPTTASCPECQKIGFGHYPGCSRQPLVDPYTEHRVNVDERADTWVYTTGYASARLEAWSRAEKPRVRNTADQREFRKAHPWQEFDESESR